jgi:hypothetical protein
MDWFERLVGFRETDYATTASRLAVEGRDMVSLVTGQRHGIGEFELASLADLRMRVARASARGRPRVRIIRGDVRSLHQAPEFNRALFQVASQFNMLEMPNPDFTPEDGVAGYASDHTQGPACAIAAGAATIYRNYLIPFGGQVGQTRERQLDALSDLGRALAHALDAPPGKLWRMQNGYAMCTTNGLAAIDRYLGAASGADIALIGSLLRVGLHWGVEVTDATGPHRPVVSQAFCAALPISYCDLPQAPWGRFAQLILDAAYEATLAAGLLHAERGGSNVVLLTRLGGGVFGNDPRWIDAAIRTALRLMARFDLDVRIVSFEKPTTAMLALEDEYG